MSTSDAIGTDASYTPASTFCRRRPVDLGDAEERLRDGHVGQWVAADRYETLHRLVGQEQSTVDLRVETADQERRVLGVGARPPRTHRVRMRISSTI